MSTSAQKVVRPLSPLPPLALIEHTVIGEERPWYDEELDFAQGNPHSKVVMYFGDLLGRVAETGGFGILSDNPIWYWDRAEQKVFYADFALVETDDEFIMDRVTANQLLLVCEIVTTSHAAKLKKDTEVQFERNERHGVPEFLLLYPDLNDDRVLEWFTLIDGRYQPIKPRRGRYSSRSVPGLVIEPLPREKWRPGQKLRVFYENRLLRPSLEEQRRADREAQRAEKLAAKLRELGIDPDSL